MNYQIKLTTADYLTYQLFTVTISKRIKKKKTRSWVLFPVALAAYGIIALNQGASAAYVFFGMAITWAMAYPFYFKWTYKRHFTKYVNSAYSQKAQAPIEIEIGKDFIYSKDADTEAKIKLKEFYAIIELPDHLLLQLKKGDTLIIPKATERFNELEHELKSKAKNFDISWQNQTEWKW